MLGGSRRPLRRLRCFPSFATRLFERRSFLASVCFSFDLEIRVTGTGDRVRAHATLGNQAALEEVLQQRGEIDVGSAHDVYSCDCSARRSKRWEASAKSSGTPVRYQ